MRRLSLLPALLAAACLAAPAVGQNLITNGSFEQPVTAADEILSASDAIPSWTISGSVGLFSNSDPTAPYQAEDGSQYIRLGTGALSQTFSDTPGKYTVVSYWANGESGDGGEYSVRYKSGSVDRLGGFGNLSGQWVHLTFSFDGSGADTVIFTGASTPENSTPAYIDNLTVTQPVPETASFLSLAALLAMLAVVAVRQRAVRRA